MGAERRDTEIKCEASLDEWFRGIEEHTEISAFSQGVVTGTRFTCPSQAIKHWGLIGEMAFFRHWQYRAVIL